MTLSRRARILSDRTYNGFRQVVDNTTGQIKSTSSNSVRIVSQQVTLSEGHEWRKLGGHSLRDIGGPFDTVKLRHAVVPRDGKAEYSTKLSGSLWEEGSSDYVTTFGTPPLPFRGIASDADAFGWPSSNLGNSDLKVAGTNFISQTIPTNPIVDGSVSLAELFREGLPSMIGSTLLKDRASFFRNLGSEYLNLEFGWKPLISDLKSASKAISDSYEILKQLEKYSGKDLRRQRILPPERHLIVTRNNSQYPGWMNNVAWTSPPEYSTSDTTTRQQWFSGCYKYYYEPSRMTELGRINTQARLLYGLEITPEVLWNLAPWSWLVDWFANVGPLLSNVSSFQQDGLVMKYGYVMETTTREYRRTVSVSGPKAGTICQSPVTDAFSGIRKRREQASPYGFGLNSSAFTNRQWAILGALGITRIPKSL